MDSQCNMLTDHKHEKKIKCHLDFTLDSESILCKTVEDHDEMFDTLVLPKTLQKYILHESHSSLEHIGSSRL